MFGGGQHCSIARLGETFMKGRRTNKCVGDAFIPLIVTVKQCLSRVFIFRIFISRVFSVILGLAVACAVGYAS